MKQTISKGTLRFFVELGLATVLLTSCGSYTAPLDDADIINRALNQLSDAQSIEYTVSSEDSVSYGEKINRNETYLEVRQITSPFAGYSKTDRIVYKTDGTTTRMISEGFQTVNEGHLDFYFRMSQEENDASNVPSLTEWQKNSLEDEKLIQSALGLRRKTDEAEIALLRENLDSFKKSSDSDTYVYQGFIRPESVLNVFRDSVRSFYIKGGFIEGPDNPSQSDLKRELISEGRPEFQSGFTKLAYSEDPIPVTLYINKDTYQMEKVILDEKTVLQAILSREIPKINPDLGEPLVTKSNYVIKIEGINTVSQLEKPI